MAVYIKKIISVCLLFFVLLECIGCAAENSNSSDGVNDDAHTIEIFAMDTVISITAYGENAAAALSEVEERVYELETLWSVTDEESDIYKINHNAGTSVAVSEETINLISFALDMARKTAGALEPTLYPVLTAWGFTTGENRVPADNEIKELLERVGYGRVKLGSTDAELEEGMMLDLGAVAKGYAADEIAALLSKAGITSALISLGGNVQAVGSKPDGSSFRVGVRNPNEADILGVIEAENEAVVTSGNYERYFTAEDGTVYGHILDPQTGYPVENELLSVTVIADEGKLCDALSTSLFVMGLDGACSYWRENGGFDVILVTKNDEIYLTPGAAERFTLTEKYSNMESYELTE